MAKPDLSIYKEPLPTQTLTKEEILTQHKEIISLLKPVASTQKACTRSGGGPSGHIGLIPYLDSAKLLGTECNRYKEERDMAAFKLAQIVWPDSIGSGGAEAKGRIEKFKKMLPRPNDSEEKGKRKIFGVFFAMSKRFEGQNTPWDIDETFYEEALSEIFGETIDLKKKKR